jgi:hypothetical protein
MRDDKRAPAADQVQVVGDPSVADVHSVRPPAAAHRLDRISNRCTSMPASMERRAAHTVQPGTGAEPRRNPHSIAADVSQWPDAPTQRSPCMGSERTRR